MYTGRCSDHLPYEISGIWRTGEKAVEADQEENQKPEGAQEKTVTGTAM